MVTGLDVLGLSLYGGVCVLDVESLLRVSFRVEVIHIPIQYL